MRFTVEYVADFCFFRGRAKKTNISFSFRRLSSCCQSATDSLLSSTRWCFPHLTHCEQNLLKLNCSKGKLPLSGLNVSRHEAETESAKCTFEISGKLHIPSPSVTASPGPLIETIVCVCPSRLEAQVVSRW